MKNHLVVPPGGPVRWACPLPYVGAGNLLVKRGPSVHGERALVLLVVEDDLDMRSLLRDELVSEGYQLREAANGEEALSAIATEVPDLILTDLKMPAGGLEYVSRLRQAVPRCPIVLMTAFGEPAIRQEALARGATVYFNKPVRIAELKATIKRLLDQQNA